MFTLFVVTTVQGTTEIPVAVKVLKDTRLEARKSLLQEAALMGQFFHGNVVKLCGVVTASEPVRIAIVML